MCALLYLSSFPSLACLSCMFLPPPPQAQCCRSKPTSISELHAKTKGRVYGRHSLNRVESQSMWQSPLAQRQILVKSGPFVRRHPLGGPRKGLPGTQRPNNKRSMQVSKQGFGHSFWLACSLCATNDAFRSGPADIQPRRTYLSTLTWSTRRSLHSQTACDPAPKSCRERKWRLLRGAR